MTRSRTATRRVGSVLWGLMAALALPITACGGDDDGSNGSMGIPVAGQLAPPPAVQPSPPPGGQFLPPSTCGQASGPCREAYGEWIKVELPETFCSDGSQYKFFVNYVEDSKDLVVMFEPGGACWDFESCKGTSIRGAANPDGIADNHMGIWDGAYPVWAPRDLGEGQDGVPLTRLGGMNRVFLPYCTGDVFAGNKTATYTSADGSETLTYRHVGQANMERVVPWLDEAFPEVARLIVGGCSAGGIGALNNYHQLRSGITGSQRGYLFNDSGPLFSSAGNSGPLHAMIREAWNIGPTLDKVRPLAEQVYGPGVFPLDEDLGKINELLGMAYPDDRLSITVYRWDFNYSLYSYDQFYPGSSNEDIYRMWGEDLDQLIAQYDALPNMGYYIPHARPDNCSHCLSIVPLDRIQEAIAGQPYLGTEIESEGIDLHDYYGAMLDDNAPLPRYVESTPPEGEGLTEAEQNACR